MDNLESKILEILKRGTPLRAAKIAAMLGVERREVNHYLYSSLKQLVVQDSDYRWSLKTNQIGHNQRIPTQPVKPHTQSSIPLRQDTLYRFTKKDIQQNNSIQQTIPTQPVKPHTQSPKPLRQDTSYRYTKKDIQQDNPIHPPIISQPYSQPVKQSNADEVVRRELANVSAEEKIQIIENALRQDKFSELEDEQINALQSILEQAKHEVNIANTAYTQGKLSFWKTNSVAIALVSITLILGTILLISQLKTNSNNQPTPTLPQSGL